MHAPVMIRFTLDVVRNQILIHTACKECGESTLTVAKDHLPVLTTALVAACAFLGVDLSRQTATVAPVTPETVHELEAHFTKDDVEDEDDNGAA